MADVYSNSPCNISATGASDSTGGFFYNRLAQLVEPCIVRTEWTDKPNDDYHIYNTKRWYDDFETCPLLKRAWVVQETVLPRRVLHFGKRQVFWECNNFEACETYPNSYPTQVDSRRSLKRTWPTVSAGNEATPANLQAFQLVLKRRLTLYNSTQNAR